MNSINETSPYGGKLCNEFDMASLSDLIEEDPLVEELDVYLCHTYPSVNTRYTLLQYPLRQESIHSETLRPICQYKSKSKMLEISTSLPSKSTNNYCTERMKEILGNKSSTELSISKSIESQTLQSTHCPSKYSSYYFGFIKDHAFYICPIDQIFQMHPSLNYLNVNHNAPSIHSGKKDEEGPDRTKAIQVQFKKKETEEELEAKLKSYSYLQKIANEEPFIPLHYLDENSSQTNEFFQKCYLMSTSGSEISFKTDHEKSFISTISSMSIPI